MHRRAEYGVAAHWGYKERRSRPRTSPWLQRIVDWQQETSDPGEFMETLKIDLEQDEVFVFTPKGKVITLPPARRRSTSRTRSTPRSATAASARASTAGWCRSTPTLASGDTVEIFTRKVEGAGPSPRLAAVRRTRRAPRTKIRQWFSRERRDDAIDTGRDELVKALRREGLPVQKLRRVAVARRGRRRRCTTPTSTRCYAAIGENHVSAKAVVAAPPAASCAAARSSCRSPCARPPERAPRSRAGVGVHVEGLDDVMVRLSRCCTPVPGDEIMGFVTRGRGVSVHRTDCANAVSLCGGQADRLIEVEWDHDAARHLRRLGRGRGARPRRGCCATSPTCSPTTT